MTVLAVVDWICVVPNLYQLRLRLDDFECKFDAIGTLEFIPFQSLLADGLSQRARRIIGLFDVVGRPYLIAARGHVSLLNNVFHVISFHDVFRLHCATFTRQSRRPSHLEYSLNHSDCAS